MFPGHHYASSQRLRFNGQETSESKCFSALLRPPRVFARLPGELVGVGCSLVSSAGFSMVMMQAVRRWLPTYRFHVDLFSERNWSNDQPILVFA